MTSQSALPASGGMTLRTREMRRSALVKVPSFSRNERARQEHVSELGGFVQENVLHHDAFHGAQGCGDVLGIRIAIWAMSSPWHIQALEAAVERRHRTCWECAGPARVERDLPGLFEQRARTTSSEMWR